MRIFFLFLSTFFLGSAFAQSSESPGGQDARPSNPANWFISRTLDGTHTIKSWHVQNGVPTVNGTIPWQLSHFQAWPECGVNPTGTNKDVSMLSEGTTTVPFTWVGVGPASSKVLVRFMTHQIWSITGSGGGSTNAA